MGVLRQPTARYTSLESWSYDRIIAPAVTAMAVNMIGEMLPRVVQGGRLLDVGCGGGQVLLEIAARRPDLELAGVDLSPEQVARAAGRARAADRPIRMVRGSALELPFRDRSFDAVISLGSIKHWPDPRRGLAECVRVTRQGGVLAVGEVDRGCTFADSRRFVDQWKGPRFIRPLAHALFRTWVAGHSFDLDDARALMREVPLIRSDVRRIAGTPALLMLGEVG